MRKRSVNIIILNYNGRELLGKYLPSVIRASKRSHHVCKVSVIDNRSSDDSVSFLRVLFPDVNLYVAKQNKVLCSFNEVVRIITDEIVIFLNNDIEIDPDFVDPLIDKFNDPLLFFVAPKECSIEREFRGGANYGSFEYGFFRNMVRNGAQDHPQYTLSVHGGAFDRNKFVELEGYDDLYLPGYVEDLDLCYRAWKRGWFGIYEPKSIMFHEGGVSFDKAFGNNQKLTMIHRNIFLFMWKNVTSAKQIFLHILFILPRLSVCLIVGRWYFVKGFFQAMGRMAQALRKRKLVHHTFVLRDEEVLAKVNGGLERFI